MAQGQRRLKRSALWTLVGTAGLVAVTALSILAVNLLVVHDAKRFIVSGPAAAPSAPVVIVPAASVASENAPSPMMLDRMRTALRLYREGKVRALDLSGYPEEVSFMVRYAKANGVPARDLLADPAASDTYDTMANARKVFHVQTALIATQRFHLSRAVYLARSMGIEAVGVPADIQPYPDSKFSTSVREWGARVKAFLMIHF